MEGTSLWSSSDEAVEGVRTLLPVGVDSEDAAVLDEEDVMEIGEDSTSTDGAEGVAAWVLNVKDVVGFGEDSMATDTTEGVTAAVGVGGQ